MIIGDEYIKRLKKQVRKVTPSTYFTCDAVELKNIADCMDTAIKALKVIESLAENSCAGPTHHKDNCVFCEIFTIAHAGRSPSCMASHPTWSDKLEAIYRELSK